MVTSFKLELNLLISFEKWHGCLNDFIVCDLPRDPNVKNALIKKAAELCSRKGAGVGADGLLLVEDFAEQANPKLTIVNSDGSIAKTCGNGIRCVANFLMIKHQCEEIILELAENHLVICRQPPNNLDGFVTVLMGEATPMSAPSEAFTAAIDQLDQKTRGEIIEGPTFWHMHNHHMIIKTNSDPQSLAQTLGPLVQQDDGINLHVVAEGTVTQQDSERAHLEVGDDIAERYLAVPFERGAGLTMACGSGACAIAADVFAQGFVSYQQWLAIDMPGGRLYVTQTAKGEPMLLAGPAVRTFTGKIDL